jgi:hypothetical protein
MANGDGFSVRYFDPADNTREARLGVIAANPPPAGPNGTTRNPGFRGDARSSYRVNDGTDPRSSRWVMWVEPCSEGFRTRSQRRG